MSYRNFKKIKRNKNLKYGKTYRHATIEGLEVDVFYEVRNKLYYNTFLSEYYFHDKHLTTLSSIHPNDFDDNFFYLTILKENKI